jgi:hypothetical protein
MCVPYNITQMLLKLELAIRWNFILLKVKRAEEKIIMYHDISAFPMIKTHK